MKKANGVRVQDKNEIYVDELQDFLYQKITGYPRGYKVEKKLKQGIFADQIRFEYFLTGENDWHSEDITHKVIEKNPNIKTLTVRDCHMFIRPDLPLESADEY